MNFEKIEKNDEKSLSIIIVTYNSSRYIANCLESIFLSNRLSISELIVVDNDSTDGTDAIVNTKFPSVCFLKNKQNLGFAKACNIGLSVASGRYTLFLNPDTVVEKETIISCINYMQMNSNIGVLACKLNNPNGSLQQTCANFPSINKFLLKSILRNPLFSDLIKAKLLLEFWSHDEIRDVDWFIGAFMMIRKDLIMKLGGFDESFFLYGEDMDLCYRIKQMRKQVVYFPKVGAVHVGNSIWDKNRLDKVHNASLIFTKKHFSPLTYHAFKLIIWAAKNYKKSIRK